MGTFYFVRGMNKRTKKLIQGGVRIISTCPKIALKQVDLPTLRFQIQNLLAWFFVLNCFYMQSVLHSDLNPQQLVPQKKVFVITSSVKVAAFAFHKNFTCRSSKSLDCLFYRTINLKNHFQLHLLFQS